MTSRQAVRRALSQVTTRLATGTYRRRQRYFVHDARLDVVVGEDVAGLDEVDFEGHNRVATMTRFVGHVVIGRGTTIHRAVFLGGPLEIGRYCQLAPFVALHSSQHPIDHLAINTTSLLLDGLMASAAASDPIRVGSDVWIGHGAVVLPGVTISDGAVVGAGSVVTKSVGPYAIAVGNPARVVRRRFDDEVVEALLRLRWWDRGPEQLEQIRELFTRPLVDDRSAVDRLESALDRLGRHDEASSRTPG
jgi:acetyltransferase-like isoleucine patch superfamily enzyme